MPVPQKNPGSKSSSPTTTSFHWNHNPESYFLIGKALGDNMVDLLSQ